MGEQGRILLLGKYERDTIIDQQIARHFVQYSECLSNPPSLLISMQLKQLTLSKFKDLIQSRILNNREVLTPLNVPLV